MGQRPLCAPVKDNPSGRHITKITYDALTPHQQKCLSDKWPWITWRADYPVFHHLNEHIVNMIGEFAPDSSVVKETLAKYLTNWYDQEFPPNAEVIEAKANLKPLFYEQFFMSAGPIEETPPAEVDSPVRCWMCNREANTPVPLLEREKKFLTDFTALGFYLIGKVVAGERKSVDIKLKDWKKFFPENHTPEYKEFMEELIDKRTEDLSGLFESLLK